MVDVTWDRMFHMQSSDARMVKWQARLARVPKWAWIAFFVGVMIPIIVLAVVVVMTAVVTGAIVMAAVLVVGGILGLIWKLLHRKPDGRKNVQIVVRSSQVIDP
jgi:VIT1/CCC1 family predicted Fe2+/Mn2+ transporter